MVRARRGPAVAGLPLLLWGAAWVGVMLVSSLGFGLLMAGRDQPSFLERWNHWDTRLLAEIAEYGYDGNPTTEPDPGLPAFFPGMPLALRLVHVVTRDWVVAGLLISLLAGAIAMVALSRLAEHEGPEGAGPRAVFALLVTPPAVFLFAGYTESMFLAFAIPAWLAARRRRWELAAPLAAGASCVRITGLFLACALVVEFLTGSRDRPWRRLPWLILPFVPPVAYSVYQYGRTGDWLAWKSAQEAGWNRHLVAPWESFVTTWNSAFNVDNTFTFAFRLELAGAAAGAAFVLGLLGWNLWRWLAESGTFHEQRWGELVYVGLQLGSLMFSAYYLSIPRSLLLWFPMWVALGRAGTRHPRVLWVYALISAPMMAALVLTFTRGGWAG